MKRYLKELVLLLAVFGGLPFDVASDANAAPSPSLRVNGIKFPDTRNTMRAFDVKSPECGAKGDGVTDDTAAVQACVNLAQAAGGGTVYFSGTGNAGLVSGTSYLITGTITMDQTVSLLGESRSAVSIILSGTSFTSNVAVGKPVAFAIATNLTTGITTNPSSHNRGGFVRNLYFYRNGDRFGSNVAYDLILLNVGASMVIENNEYRNFWSVVYGASGYVDEIHVRDAYFHDPHGTGYQISIGSLGDGQLIEGLSFDQPNTGGGTVHLLNVNNSRLTSLINLGYVLIENSDGVTVSNMHGEAVAQVELKNCRNCAVVDSTFYKQDTATVPIKVSWDSTLVLRGMSTVLDNNQFIVYGDRNSYANDVQINTSVARVEVRNCWRRFIKTTADSEGRSTITGISVEDQTATAWPTFNQRSYIFSKWSQIESGTMRFHADMEAQPAPNAWLQGNGTDGGPWQASSATYFYTVAILTNAVKGPIASTNTAEQSIALTNAGLGGTLTISSLVPTGGVNLRFFRGTTTGVYTSYVDIPYLSGLHFYDNGTQLNGFPWINAGVPSTTAGIGQATAVAYRESHDRFEAFSTAAPTAGTWAVQDTFWNTTPASGGPLGWVCTAAGTPGTWVPFGMVNNSVTGNFSQSAGTFSMAGNGSSSCSTSSGTLTVDGPTVSIGGSTATSIPIGNVNTTDIGLNAISSSTFGVKTPTAATAGTTTQNPGTFYQRSRYWNGSASTVWDFSQQHILDSTAPASHEAYLFSGSEKFRMSSDGTIRVIGTTFASLPAASNGSIDYCSDCTIANPCAGGGTGAIAKRLNGAWVCN